MAIMQKWNQAAIGKTKFFIQNASAHEKFVPIYASKAFAMVIVFIVVTLVSNLSIELRSQSETFRTVRPPVIRLHIRPYLYIHTQ